jgi:serine/threonine protein kinase
MSPERLQGGLYDKSGDVWSVGIMALELWTSRYPLAHCCSTPVELLHELDHFQLDHILNTADFPKRVQRFIAPMLVLDPRGRISTNELVHAEWFNSFGLFSLDIAQQVTDQPL